MVEITTLIDKYFTKDLLQATLSNPRSREEARKIQIRPVERKGEILFQASIYKDNKVFHKNMERALAVSRAAEWMREYRQLEVSAAYGHAHVLISKKGQVTIKEKKGTVCVKQGDLSHNRKKRYLLDTERPIEFLVDLGVQTPEGKIVNARYDKFRQINRFLEFIEDILPKLPKEREVNILDFGCGKSYLTFAMYYYLKIQKGYQVRITGLDLKEDVIEKCGSLAKQYGYEGLHFAVGDIQGYQAKGPVDMVVTLHACDTATDYALDQAIRWGAKVILSVPCCQHELNGQIQNEMLAPVLKYGLLKERLAALITDGLRAEILESKGYDVQVMEFIDMEHTPKNILIRAVKGQKEQKPENYRRLAEFLHVNPTLARLQEERTNVNA